MNNLYIIKDRLNEALRVRNMSRSELAEKSGINKGTISRYLRGETIPRSPAIGKLAQVLNVNPAWILGYDVPMEDGIDTESDISPFSADFLTKMTDVQQQLIMEVMKLSPDNQFKMSNFMKFLLFEQGLDENGYPIEDSQEADTK